MTTQRSPFTLRAAVRRQAVLLAVLAALGVAVAIGAVGNAPLAGLLLAGILGVCAVLRGILPTTAVGALAVRSKITDMAVLLVLAIGLGVLSGAPNL